MHNRATSSPSFQPPSVEDQAAAPAPSRTTTRLLIPSPVAHRPQVRTSRGQGLHRQRMAFILIDGPIARRVRIHRSRHHPRRIGDRLGHSTTHLARQRLSTRARHTVPGTEQTAIIHSNPIDRQLQILDQLQLRQVGRITAPHRPHPIHLQPEILLLAHPQPLLLHLRQDR